MPDGDVLKEFFVSLGWKVDEASSRRAQESLKRTHEQVNRFRKSTNEGASSWQKFFEQFRRSEHPQRQHLETTLRLNKAYELLGVNLKQLATFAAGGSLVASFATLTDQFDKLYYSAQQAGTSVGSLMKLQFGGQQVGVSPAEMTAALINLRRALGGIPGPGIAQIFNRLGLNVLDPTTGRIKDTSQALQGLLEGAGKLYRSSPAGPGLAQQLLGRAGISLTPALEQLLKNPDILRDMLAQAQKFTALQNAIGVDVDDLANKSRLFVREWNEFLSVLGLIQAKFEGPLITPITNFFKIIEDGLIKIASPGGLADQLTRSFQAGDFAAIGKKAADAIIAELTAQSPAWLDAGIKAADDFANGFASEVWMKIRSSVPGNEGFEPHARVEPQNSWLWGRMKQWWSGSTQAAPGAPAQAAPGAPAQAAPHFQHGGVVPIMAHAGELIFGADLTRMFTDWLRGGGGFRPLVHVDNDFANDFAKALPGEGESGPGFGRPRHGDPFGLSGRRSSSPGLGDPHTALQAIEHFESSGRNVMNHIGDALHTASGFFQITNSTWRRAAAMYGIDISGYPTAMSAPRALQERVASELYKHEGWGPWAPYNAKLRGFLRSHPGFPEAAGGAPGVNVFAGAHHPLGIDARYHHVGDRTVTLNAQNNFNIHGADALGIGGALSSATSRTNADLVRNLTPLIQ